MREVRAQLGREAVDIHMKLFSLEEVNRPKDEGVPVWEDPEEWPGTQFFRGAVYVRRKKPEAEMDYMIAVARKRHDEGRKMGDGLAMFEEAVAEVGLDPADFRREAFKPGVLDALRDEHTEAVSRGIFGVPTLVMNGGMCFLAMAPYQTGAKALEVWDAVQAFCKLSPIVREMKAPADEAEKARQSQIFAASRAARETGRQRVPTPVG